MPSAPSPRSSSRMRSPGCATRGTRSRRSTTRARTSRRSARCCASAVRRGGGDTTPRCGTSPRSWPARGTPTSWSPPSPTCGSATRASCPREPSPPCPTASPGRPRPRRSTRRSRPRWRPSATPSPAGASVTPTCRGHRPAYARGRGEFRTMRKRPTVDGLHEWRKRVTDLWYHASLLEAAWPKPMKALGREAHALSDLLGDDHDLGVLAERFAAQAWPPSVDVPPSSRSASVVARARGRGLRPRREGLRREARRLRRRISRYLAG